MERGRRSRVTSHARAAYPPPPRAKDSLDQSLKYLLKQHPADFVRFALRDPAVRVLRPVPSGLPSRSRDIDGAYFIEHSGGHLIAHFEFHRRHQSAKDLAVDVGEAQIRLYRREGLEVVSLVWDLYGAASEPVTEERSFAYGAKILKKGSRVVYLRVNLRGLGWKTLLAKAPPALWPLVALARDGACEEALHRARDAIVGRTDLTAGEQADHLAVLWFIAEAEDVPVRVMKEYITEAKLMASTLYQSIFEKGEAKRCAETILRILTRRLGTLDPAVATRIRAESNLDTLDVWLNEALDLPDAESAHRLVEKIGKASLS
jgi:hypothetical protein